MPGKPFRNYCRSNELQKGGLAVLQRGTFFICRKIRNFGNQSPGARFVRNQLRYKDLNAGTNFSSGRPLALVMLDDFITPNK